MYTVFLLAVFAVIFAFAVIALFLRTQREVRALRLQILARRSHLQNIRLAKILAAENTRLIGEGIDQGTLFLHAGQKTVANLTYGILEMIPATRSKAQMAREKHEQIGEGITNVLRAVNRHVGERIAEGIREGGTSRRRRVRPRKKKRMR